MCNLYRYEPRQYGFNFKLSPRLGNNAPMYVGADQDGPVLVSGNDGLELTMMRWGFPPTSARTRDGKWAAPITNIRNLESRWWQDVNRRWLTEKAYRCLVPFARFAEPVPGKGRENAWFEATTENAFFAGIWRPWTGDTRLVPVDGKARRQRAEASLDLFAFLTTEPNDIVRPIHPKAMPVILTEAEEISDWMAGGVGSLVLQRPLDPDLLQQVAEP